MMCKYPYMKNATGGSPGQITLSKEARDALTPFPCGQCLPCTINKSREWTCRILLEAAVNQSTCFTTLTYNDWCMPENESLCKKDFEKFLRKLRKRVSPIQFRFFGIGEYGLDGVREYNPHYHLVLYGLDSSFRWIIDKSWTHNGEHIGRTDTVDVTQELAAYITGYTTKKLNKPGGLDSDKKEIREKNKKWFDENFPWFDRNLHSWEFMRSSKQEGGIGLKAVEKLAEKIKATPHWDLETVTRQIKLGARGYPLGRYLTRKLAEELGQGAALAKSLHEYQNQLFADHLATDSGSQSYYMNIVNENESKRRSQLIKREMFEKQRRL